MVDRTALTATADIQEAYAAAHGGAIFVDRSDLGMLKFTGKTRLDLLNRMSTQKVVNLASGQGAATVLTSDIGRIIDRIILYAASNAVYCLTGENNGSQIADYLKRFVFFMDDFQIEDLSHDTVIFAVYGQKAASTLASLLDETIDLDLHHWREAVVDQVKLYLHKTDPVAGDGFFVMCQEPERMKVRDLLVKAGATPAGREAFEYLRIESGLPRFGYELTGDYIPLETGLWDDVSFNKGCYTGQEIIARMESRGKLAKKMIRVRPSESIQQGVELRSKGKVAGVITLAADGPVGPLAIAYVKSAFLQNDAPLTAGDVAVRPI